MPSNNENQTTSSARSNHFSGLAYAVSTTSGSSSSTSSVGGLRMLNTDIGATSLSARAPSSPSSSLRKTGGDGTTIMDGATILPCRARRMPKNHNEKTAFFMVYRGITKHGEPLLCCHPACRERGVRFVYCSVCNIPAALCNFASRHAHNDLNINQESYDFTLRHKQKLRGQKKQKKQNKIVYASTSGRSDSDSQNKKKRSKERATKKRKRQEKRHDAAGRSYPEGSTVTFAVEAHPPRPPPRYHFKHHKTNDETSRERSPERKMAAADARGATPSDRAGSFSDNDSSSKDSSSSTSQSSYSSFQEDEVSYQSSDMKTYQILGPPRAPPATVAPVSCSSLSMSSSSFLKNPGDKTNGSADDSNSDNSFGSSHTRNSTNVDTTQADASKSSRNHHPKEDQQGQVLRQRSQETCLEDRRTRVWLDLLKIRPRDHGSDEMSAWLMTLLAVSDRNVHDIDRLKIMVDKLKKNRRGSQSMPKSCSRTKKSTSVA